MVVAANVLLGIRGMAIGLNEAAGYIGLSAAAALSGYVAAVSSLRTNGTGLSDAASRRQRCGGTDLESFRVSGWNPIVLAYEGN